MSTFATTVWVDPAPVVSAEADSVSTHEDLGAVGGPFPWLEPLGLTWPGPRPDGSSRWPASEQRDSLP